MRIGLVAAIPVTIDRFFSDWVAAWIDQGDEVHVALADGGLVSARPTSVTAIPGLGRRPSMRSVSTPGDLESWCRDRQLDVILTNTATPSAVSRLAIRSTPIVYFCHGLHWRDSRDWPAYAWSGLERLLLRRSSGVICMNDADESWFRARYAGPILRLRAGIGLDLDEWRQRPTPADRRVPLLLWIGEFTSRKRPHDALAVLRSLAQLGYEAELVMLGGGPLHANVDAAARPVDEVSFPGHVDPRSFLIDATALIHTSEWEGYARVLMESVAMGVPAFGYDTKGVRDVPGVVFGGSPGDAGAIARALVNWMAAGEPAVDIERNTMDWRVAFAEVNELLRRVARPGGSAG
ncbi:MAG: hypothetical protein QG597_1700 [Actinomycetota bacterium]|nr:hypothetical protein [Actinomycetota bacterium]